MTAKARSPAFEIKFKYLPTYALSNFVIVDHRLEELKIWLKNVITEPINEISIASADASFRRYFRIHTETRTLIAMDAPPEKENSALFIDSATALSSLGVNTPNIYAHDISQGFVLLEDFGDRTFLDELQSNAESLYSNAINSLIRLQTGSLTRQENAWHPPAYDGKKLIEEMSLFSKWFIARHLGQTLHEPSFAVWLHTQQYLASACLQQPQVWVHRDFHSRNLMILESSSETTPAEKTVAPIGVIDFQDSVIGPIGYDLASIFKDCYIEWPRVKQHEWLQQYRLKVLESADIKLQPFSLEQLIRWVDFAGLQRHLKVLGIFCRLNYRDGKSHYLNDLPLVAKYVLEVLDIYPELSTFKNHFEGHIRQAL